MTFLEDIRSDIAAFLSADDEMAVDAMVNSTACQGIFVELQEDTNVGNYEIEGHDAYLMISEGNFTATGVELGDLVSVSATNYTVISIQDNESGLHKLLLSRVIGGGGGAGA